jgi:hypothetical protein
MKVTPVPEIVVVPDIVRVPEMKYTPATSGSDVLPEILKPSFVHAVADV